MIVFHMAVATSDDYLVRREPHRRAHLERLQGLRAAGILIGGGPSPDGKSADLFYRLQQPMQPGDVADTCADVDELMREVGYRPDTSVETGVQSFVTWYRSYYDV